MAGRPPTKDAPPFGKRLAALRRERGFTQEQLADELGLTRKMIDYYERRARNPSTEIVSKIAALFDVPVGVLLGEQVSRRRSKPGPPSALEERIEKIRQLPRKEQEFVIRMLDTVLDGARR